MKKILQYGLIIMLVTEIMACTDNLNKAVSDKIVYQPEYSLPIGPVSYSLGQIMPLSVLGPSTDTVALPDTTYPILYDEHSYRNPSGHDTLFILPYDFSILADQAQKVRALMLRVNYTNEFPTYSDLQVYFMDGNSNVLDSLFIESLYRLEPAEIDRSGMVVAPFIGQKDTELDSVKIRHLVNSKFLGIYIFVATIRSGQNVVHLYSSSSLDLQFAVRAWLEIPVGG